MRTASKDIGWDMVFLFACAIQLSGSLSGDGTGIATLMSSSLGAVLGAHNEFVIILVLAVVSLILTNFANNWVVLMLMISALALSAQSLTVNISLAFIMIVFCGNIGFVLPSASIYGAMLHGNESVSPKDIYQYTSICIVITIITVCIFIPIGGMFIK